jgi:RNA polymerase sigma factor (sigma-70 family)
MKKSTASYMILKQNREKGIQLLFEWYAKKLQTYAVYKWKTEADVAWDLIYKTIYRVADVVHNYSFDSEEKFASFIFKVFINYLRNQHRDEVHQNAGVKEIELNEYIINNYSPAEESENKSMAFRLLQQELDLLEDWQRILMLMRSQDVPYKDITHYTGRSEDQLKVYYGRIKKQISEKIAAQLTNLKPSINAK